jgi:hypothetical protein
MTGNEWLVYVILPFAVAALGAVWAGYVERQIKRNRLADQTNAKREPALKNLNAAE